MKKINQINTTNMSDKNKEIINYSLMYIGFLAMIGSILYNFITTI